MKFNEDTIPDGLLWDAYEYAHRNDWLTKHASRAAAYFWSLSNASGDYDTIATLDESGISVLQFDPTEDEIKEFDLPEDEPVFLIEDDQGFTYVRHRWP